MQLNIEDFPERKTAEIQRIVSRYEAIFPDWLKSLTFFNRTYYKTDSKETICQVNVEMDYLRASIEIFEPFWNISCAAQVLHLRHEFIHIILAPLSICAEDILGASFRTDERGPAYAFMKKKLNEAIEATTVEIAKHWIL